MTAVDLSKRIAELPPEKRALLFQQLQKQQEKERPAEAPGIGGTAGIARQSRAKESHPLSFAQQRLWFLNHFEPESPEYNIPQALRITGEMDPAVMQRALREVVRRHETLRTTFRSEDGTPAQVIAQVVDMEVPFLDVRDRVESPDAAWGEALRMAAADAKEPFDLTLGPLMRARLYRTGETEHLLYYNVHHIAYDGWSQGIFARELAAVYDAFAVGQPSPLPELPVQYLDFAIWQREWLQGAVLEEQLAYWRRQLASVPPLEMPTDRPRPAVRTHNGAAVPLVLDKALAGGLKALAQRESSTMFIVLNTAFKALLHHWTTQEDVAVGTLIGNRRRPEIEGLIGFFANTLVLRTDLSGDPTFRELLAREREVSLDAHAHQDVPFEKLVEELNPPRDMARTPLFQVMLILLNAPGKALDLPGLKLAAVPIDSRTSKMEMTVYLTETDGGLDGFIEYNSDLYDRATLQRFAGHFRTLLAAVAADPEIRLSELPLLSDDERRRELVEWNATRVDLPRITLHGLIEERVRETPEAPAVEMEGTVLTYRELDERANRLARYLRRLGAGPETLVGVAMERSLEMLVSVLAVLKSGGAYVPLDPEYPLERLAYMLEDSGLPVLLTQERLLDKLPKIPENTARAVAVDRDAAAIEAESADPIDAGTDPANVAYVIYTSGSTGKPKGVQVTHASVVNFLLSMSRKPGLTSSDVLLAVTTLSFDIAGLELYLPLIVGARVVLVSRDTSQAGEQLAEVIDRRGVTAMQATPATWRLLLGAGWLGSRGLKILCGGEALPRDLASQLLGACGSLWNVYGPTEATIWSTLDEVGQEGPITIGRPLENTEIYLLSRRLNPVPAGVPGELLLGGAGLARGYLGRPDLAADRFIPHLFSEQPGARLYRTGDLARRLPDGRVDFLGRIDHQVKVRGFRIELGDIEAALAGHSAIGQAVVVAREDTPGSKRLAAYMVTAPGVEAPSVTDLRAYLREKLPEYMIPALFTFLEALPLTPNGKVDRRALPAPDKSAAAREYVAPRDEKEQFFCELWQELLGMERVGVNDDFFELGGDSLLVIRVVTKANKAAMGITTKQVFQHRTVAELAAVAGTIEILAEQGVITGPKPFTPAELHFLDLRHANPDYHSIGTLLEPKEGELNLAFLEKALEHAMLRHDNLRVRVETGVDSDRPRLVLEPPGAPVNLLRVDLSALPEDRRFPTMAAAIRQQVISFTMAAGNLVRTVAYDFEPGKVRYLFMTAHFMAADVGSWQILLDDVDAAYRRLEEGKPIEISRKTTSARQWAERLAERAQPGGMPQQERDYWLAQAPLNPPRFPMDHDLGPNDWISAKIERAELDLDESDVLLQQVPRFHGVQIDAIFATAILSAFEGWIGSRSLPILLLGHGREALYDDMDLTRTIGWFNTIYPVLLDMGPNPGLVESARELNRQLRRVPHGGTGYGILRYLSNDPDIAGHLAKALEPQVFFNYMGPDNAKELGRLKKIQNFGGYHQDRTTKRMCPITISGHIIEDKVLMKWEYNQNLHKPETIQPLARRCGEVLRWFVQDYRARA